MIIAYHKLDDCKTTWKNDGYSLELLSGDESLSEADFGGRQFFNGCPNRWSSEIFPGVTFYETRKGRSSRCERGAGCVAPLPHVMLKKVVAVNAFAATLP